MQISPLVLTDKLPITHEKMETPRAGGLMEVDPDDLACLQATPRVFMKTVQLLQTQVFVSSSFYGTLWREYMTLFKSPRERGGTIKPQKWSILDPLSV